jgi:hypothetical protein
VSASLRALAHQLRGGGPLDQGTRQELADLVDQLGVALGSSAVPPAEAEHLAASTTHLLQALHQGAGGGILGGTRERLQQAILRAELHAPFAAGIAQRLVDALANLGI